MSEYKYKTIRERAQERLERRKEYSEYQQYLAAQKDYEARMSAQKNAVNAPAASGGTGNGSGSSSSWWDNNAGTRTLATVLDGSVQVAKGLGKAVEGFVDAFASIGALFGWVDKAWIERDWTEELSESWGLNDVARASYVSDWGTFGEILQGTEQAVGQMLPNIVLGVTTGGASAAAQTVAKGVGLGMLGVSAAGNNTESALKEGATMEQAAAYGALMGGTEIGTELLVGKGLEKLTGVKNTVNGVRFGNKSAVAGGVTNAVAKQGAKRVLGEMFEEGVEEVVSDIIDPFARRIYDKDAIKNAYVDNLGETLGGMGKSFATGALASAVMGGAQAKLQSALGRKSNGAGISARVLGDVSEAVAEINSLEEKVKRLEKNGKIDTIDKRNGKTLRQNAQESIRANVALIENTLSGLDDAHRKAVMNQFGLGETRTLKRGKVTVAADNVIGKDGKVTTEYLLKHGIDGARQNAAGDYVESDGKVVVTKKVADMAKNAVVSSNADLVRIQKAVDKAQITPYTGTKTADGKTVVWASEEAESDYSAFDKAFRGMSEKNGRLAYIVADGLDADVDGFTITSDGTVVISRDQFGKGNMGETTTKIWMQTLFHEGTHIAEGTKGYGKVFKMLWKDKAIAEKTVKAFLKKGYLTDSKGVRLAYDDAAEYLFELEDKVNKGEKLSVKEARDLEMYISEFTAIATGELLGNEEYIRRLAREDDGLVKKIMNALEDIKSRKLGVTSEFSDKVYKRYLQALEQAGKRYENGNIVGRKDDEEENIKKSNGPVMNGLLPYDDKRAADIRKKSNWNVAASYEDVIEFVEKSLQGKAKYTRLYLGMAPVASIEKINAASGLDMKSWEIALDSNDVTHIFNNHGDEVKESSRGQIAVTIENFNTIIDAIIDPDKVSLIKDTYTKLQFEKDGDVYVVAITIVGKGRHDPKRGIVSLKTVTIKKSAQKKQPTSPTLDIRASRPTPENDRRLKTASTDSIRNNSDDVNTFSKKSSKNSGMRYSLNIGGENVNVEAEQTSDLVALHNLSEAKLLKVLELGGFPMPSIAVTTPSMSHSDYGDITVIFGRETIDPQANKRNKVYSKDGWTPTVPAVEYKPNERVLSKIKRKHYELAQRVGYEQARPLYNFTVDMERELKTHNGEIGLIAELYDDTELMNLFLIDTGAKKVEPIYREIRTEMSEGEKTYRERLIEAFGREFLAEWDSIRGSEPRKAFIREHKEHIVNTLAPILQGKESIEETRANISKNFSIFALGNTLNKATNYIKEGSVSIRTEYDAAATQAAIRKATPKQEYIRWIDDLFGGIEEKKGIYNCRDPYTNSGNRRSFEALHYEYTLDNIVEAMMDGDEKGGSSWHGLTLGQLQAKLAKEFKTVDEIKQNTKFIKPKDEAAHELFTETARKMITEISDEMVGGESRYNGDMVAYWTALDSAQMVIGEIADNRLFTLEKIAAFMAREYSRSYRYNDGIGNKILGLFEYIRSMNNTDYFEAKPRRAVAFSEIKNVLIPESASQKLRQQLKAKNIPFQVYGLEENARTEAIKRMEGIRFSRKITMGMTDAERYDILKGKSITLSAKVDNSKLDSAYKKIAAAGMDVKLDGTFNTAKETLLKKIVDEFGLKKDYYNSDVDLDFSFTYNKLHESLKKQNDNYELFAKMLTCFDSVIENAIGIEAHNRNDEGYKKDPNLIQMYVLASAFIDGEDIVPVKLEVKESRNAPNTLYVILALQSIKIDEVIAQGTPKKGFAQETRSSDTINILDLLRKVNPSDESFTKYFPKQLYNDDPDIRYSRNGYEFEKEYTLAEASDVVTDIVNAIVLDDNEINLEGSKTQVIDMLYNRLNNATVYQRPAVAAEIADYIVQHAVMENAAAEDLHASEIDRLRILRSYMHGINLSGIQADIVHKYGKKNALFMQWGNKNGPTADAIAQELAEYGIPIQAENEADIFFEIVDEYNAARSALKKLSEKMTVEQFGDRSAVASVRNDIVQSVMNAFDEKGKLSEKGKLLKKIEELEDKLKTIREVTRLTNSINRKADTLKGYAKREYVSSAFLSSVELEAWIKELGGVERGANLASPREIRERMIRFAEFFNRSNDKLFLKADQAADSTLSDGVSETIKEKMVDALDIIKQNAYTKKGKVSAAPLTALELRAIDAVLGGMANLYKNYDTVFIGGVKHSAEDIARKQMELYNNATRHHIGKGLRNWMFGAFMKTSDARAVFNALDGYEKDGIFKKLFKDITDGETARDLMCITLTHGFDEFYKKHKGYAKRLVHDLVRVGNAELTVGQAITLYMLSMREQAQEGLIQSGITYYDEKGHSHSATFSGIDESIFTDTDKQYIELVKKFFWEDAGKIKTQADERILGFHEELEERYFPIRRDPYSIATRITDSREFVRDMANNYNFSFNKAIRKGAKNTIYVGNISDVLNRHALDLSTYACLTETLRSFDMIYGRQVNFNTMNGRQVDIRPSTDRSLREHVNRSIWDGAERYLQKFFRDLQGSSGSSSTALDKLRSGFAQYQLGANPKVIVSQLTSYPMAFAFLDVKSLAKGAVMAFDHENMDKYCPYAFVRNYEHGVVRAEGVIDKVGKAGEVLTKPIQAADRFTIGRLWNACRVQVETDTGYKIGTEENNVRAGELLEEVIRGTQPNYSNTERSELMRSDSDIVKSFTMFTSVPLKQLSRLVERFGVFQTYRMHLRAAVKGTAEYDEALKDYKKARKDLARAAAAVTAANLMYVLVGQFFKWLFNKDRKDKDGNEIGFGIDLLLDFASTTVGMLPIVRDIYAKIFQDRDVTSFYADSINNVVDATTTLWDLAVKTCKGEAQLQDGMSALRSSLYGLGMLFGLPFRNINNTVTGIIKRFSPSTAYEYNSMFYNAQYAKDIRKAQEKGDTKLASTIMTLMLNDRVEGFTEATQNEIVRLYGADYNVMPRAVANTLTVDGEEVALTARQKETFQKTYYSAAGKVSDMLRTKAYAEASDDVKARAIKFVFDSYYDVAVDDLLGTDTSDKNTLFAMAFDVSSLAVILAELKALEADRDRNGNVINGSRKRKVQAYVNSLRISAAEKYMIMGYLGYINVHGRAQVRSFIQSRNMSKREKETLFSYCGYAG